jgi:hypothetical protein
VGATRLIQITHATLRRKAAVLVLTLIAAVPLLLLLSASPAHAAAAKGIMDWRLEMPEGVADLATIQPIVDDMGPAGLNARWTRLYFRWARLQPSAPGTPLAADADLDGYDDAYVAELDAIVAAFRLQGVKVILTGTDVPEWASDSRYWAGHSNHSDVVPAIGRSLVLTAWRDLARFLAARYRGKGAQHFEVWNEPNLSSGLYPQLVGAKKTPVGPAVYLKMLKAFSLAAHQGTTRRAPRRSGSRRTSRRTAPSSTSTPIRTTRTRRPGRRPCRALCPREPRARSRWATSACCSRSSRRRRST